MKGDCSSSRALNSSEVIVKPDPRATGAPDFLLFWGEHATASAHRPRTRKRRTRKAPSRGVPGCGPGKKHGTTPGSSDGTGGRPHAGSGRPGAAGELREERLGRLEQPVPSLPQARDEL